MQGRKEPSFFTKKNTALAREEEGLIKPAARESNKYFSMATHLGADKEKRHMVGEKCREEDQLHNHTVDEEEERQLGTD